jgi:transcriptional regulator with XRE-family HTH domain
LIKSETIDTLIKMSEISIHNGSKKIHFKTQSNEGDNQMTVGQKIHFFRTQKKLSQSEVEVGTDLAFGALSRIECGKTAPTKETIFKIAKFLNLRKLEIDYLIGISHNPVSEEELNKVKNELGDYFNKKGVLAYLLDERDRIMYVSRDFVRLLEFNEKELNEALGRPLLEIMLNPKFKIFDLINTDEFEQTVYSALVKYYYDVHFMLGDRFFEDSIEAIKSNPITKKMWEEISANPPVNVNTLESRKVAFNLNGKKINMVYSAEYVATNSRLIIIEYTPTNLVLKLLTKFL